MPVSPSRRPSRAWRSSGVRLLALLVIIGPAAEACTSSPSPTPPASPVLGRPSASTDVMGQPAPAGTDELDAVSCADVERCWAVGAPGPDAAVNSTAVLPPSPATVIDATVDGGQTWTAEPLALGAAPALTGISCPGVAVCMAVGSSGTASATGIVLTTRNGGASWVENAPPVGAIVVTSVLCTDDADCTAVATDGTTIWSTDTTDFGGSWQREGNLPGGLVDARDLSCMSGGSCLVAGYTATTTGHGQGAIIISVDGGSTWNAANVPAGVGPLQSVTCASVTLCLAVGTTSTIVSDVVPAKGELLQSRDGGHTWTQSQSSQSVDDIYGIDCPQPEICAMVGTRWIGHPDIGTGAVAQSTDGGTSFKESTMEYTALPLTALACPTSRFCIAVGSDTVARMTLPKSLTVSSHHPRQH